MKRIVFSLLIFLFFISSSNADQGFGLREIKAGAGPVFANLPEKRVSYLGFSTKARADMGEIYKTLRLSPEINYMIFPVSPADGKSWTWSVLSFSANFNRPFKIDGVIEPYAAIGIGLNFIRTSAEDDNVNNLNKSDFDIGVNLIGGAKLLLEKPIRPYMEFRYGIVRHIQPASIMVGISYAF